MSQPASSQLPVRVPGRSLPREYYTEPDLFDLDLEAVFYRNWLFAAHTCEVANPGDYVVFTVGAESILLARDEDGVLHGHFNVCRHRGSRIATGPCGNARALVCPYHQWVYGMDGQLRAARHMGEEFDVADYRLRPVAVRELAGLIFVCLAQEPPSFEPAVTAIEPQVRPHGLAGAKVARRYEYQVRANWKTLIENNRECYHCRGSHPEFCLSNFDLGSHGDARRQGHYEKVLSRAYARWRLRGLAPAEVSFPDGGWYRVTRLPLKDGFDTESLDGELVAPLMGQLTGPGTGSLRIVTLPNLWAHANCDYAMTTRVIPLAAGLTKVDITFLVDADAQEGVDYDPDKLTKVWQATSEQDWELCEENYAGIQSRGYVPGPYSTVTENSVEAFVNWYLTQLDMPVDGWR